MFGPFALNYLMEVRYLSGLKIRLIRRSGCPSEHPRTARLVERINKQPLLGMLAQAYPEQ